MKTPEEIKKVLKYCLDRTGCCICPYRGGPPDICRGKLFHDVLEYITQLEKECATRERLSNRLHKELEAANRESDIMQNCGNCAYENAIGIEASYCYDCKWFTDEATRIKWTERKRDEGY